MEKPNFFLNYGRCLFKRHLQYNSNFGNCEKCLLTPSFLDGERLKNIERENSKKEKFKKEVCSQSYIFGANSYSLFPILLFFIFYFILFYSIFIYEKFIFFSIDIEWIVNKMDGWMDSGPDLELD